MAEKSGIEWTDATFNPWWGCAKVSPGCDHCYAERDAGRYQPGIPLWGLKRDGAVRRHFGDTHWNNPVRWNRRAEREGRRLRVFCASMADVFDKDALPEERARLFRLIEQTPHLDWLVLTKRIGNAVPMMIDADFFPGACPNFWLGISVVNQAEADRDVPKLLRTPAWVRFLSIEPMLERVDLCEVFGMWWNQTMGCWESKHARPINSDNFRGHERGIDWMIVGGESGPGARPMDPEWALSLARQADGAGAAFFFKQGSQRDPRWPDFKNPATFPEGLRRREWPISRWL
jgi:protein gp37